MNKTNEAKPMDTSSSIVETSSPMNFSNARGKKLKRKRDSSTATRRSKLLDMVFYDGNRHPAAVLHELRPDISSDKYGFQLEESDSKRKCFRCSVTIDQNGSDSVTAVGHGRSKQSAKNMAAQVSLQLPNKYSNHLCHISPVCRIMR